MGVVRPRRHDCPFAAVFLVPIMIVLQGRRNTPCPSANQMHNVTKVRRSTFMGRTHDIAMPANDEAYSGLSLEECRYGWLGPGRARGPHIRNRFESLDGVIDSTVLSNPIAPICQLLDGKTRATWQTPVETSAQMTKQQQSSHVSGETYGAILDLLRYWSDSKHKHTSRYSSWKSTALFSAGPGRLYK